MNKSILVIGTQRSGTSNLIKSFGVEYKLNTLQWLEPWNYHSPFVRESDTSTNWTKTPYDLSLIKSHTVLVKTQSHQKPKHYPGSSIDFLLELVDRFDKNRIILICRKDYDKHIISYTNLRYTIYQHGYWSGKTNFHWKESDIPKSYLNNEKEQKLIHSNVTEQRKLLFEISDKLNIGITWYEDLYGNDRSKSLDIIKSWNFDINEERVNKYLDPKFKYNRTNTTNII